MIVVLYIDLCTTIALSNDVARFNGGGLFAIHSANLLISKIGDEVTLLFPSGSESSNLDELIPTEWKGIKRIYTHDFDGVSFNAKDMLFLPVVNGTTLLKVSRLKRKFKEITIAGVLHDKCHNLKRSDFIDLYYFKNRAIAIFNKILAFRIKRILFRIIYDRCIRCFDLTFTVSNYSLQELSSDAAACLNVWKSGSVACNRISLDSELPNCNHSYCLFVSGGRPEKNLLRTLRSYCKLFETGDGASYSFVVTGVPKNLESLLLRDSRLNKSVLNKMVEFKDYVDAAELEALITGASFLAFTSKGEGFGLPVMEAICRGKAVMASRQTSIPEVAGAAVYYVDAMSEDSITKGLRFFNNFLNVIAYERFAISVSNSLREVFRIEDEISIDKILMLYRDQGSADSQVE